MTRLGELNTDWAISALADVGFDTATAQSTTSATLEDISGLTFDLDLAATGRIYAIMVVQCSTTGGSAATGAWAVEINSVDGPEIQRYLSGSNDTGSVSTMAQSASLGAGTYTIQGRHRRVSGVSTVNSDTALLMAFAVLD